MKKVFIKILSKRLLCRRDSGHSGACSPNLVGQKFGSITIVRLDIKKSKKSKVSHWVIDQKGALRTVTAHDLLSGDIRGKVDLSGGKGWGSGAIYETVRNHYSLIFRKKLPTYKDMPFFERWNPDYGGSFWRAVKRIQDVLGNRPKNHSLNIIDHRKGFVPNNLEWADGQTQARNRNLKLSTLFQIKRELKHRGYRVVKI